MSDAAEGPHGDREAVRDEMRDLLRADERRRRQFPRALSVGALAGLVAVAVRECLAYAEHLRDGLVAHASRYPPWGVLAPIAFGALFGWLSVLLVQRWSPEAAGSGIPHIKAVLHHLRPMVWWRVIPVKLMGGLFGIGAGLALGREGPTIQIGGALGDMVSRWLRTSERSRQTLIAAGAGAGLAAAFNAPLSGLVFVLEEVQQAFTPAVFTASFIASITADVVTRWLTGPMPVFHVAVGETPPIESLPVFGVLGVLTGLFGVLFNRSLLLGLDLFHRARALPLGAAGAIVGAIAGLVAWFAPSAVGTGTGLIERMFQGELGPAALMGFFVLRLALTSLSYGSGAPGGIFAPLLVLGAQIGLLVAAAASVVTPHVVVAPVAYAVVGMAAYFTAIVRAPLTGIVLIVEMTGGYSLILPLLVACFVAYATADLMGDLPIYERLLERELRRGRPAISGSLLFEISIQRGAPFDGAEVRALSLPAGAKVVAVRRGREERTPTPEMRLAAGDTMVLVIPPHAVAAVEAVRRGAVGEGRET
jgi:chloride channel protein, CIC family